MSSNQRSFREVSPTECSVTGLGPDMYSVYCRGGHLRFALGADAILLTDMEVPEDQRRMGVGRMMLRRVAVEAQVAGVGRIAADLTTRAAVDAAAHAYGSETVHVILSGDYEPHEPDARVIAVASLDYSLPEEGLPADFLDAPPY